NESKPMLLAANLPTETPGLVLDYVMYSGGYSEPTEYDDYAFFNSNTTYVVIGQCAIMGDAYFSGGAVIKYFAADTDESTYAQCPDSGMGALELVGGVLGYANSCWQYGTVGDDSSPSQRIYFTSTVDNSVGELTSGMGDGPAPAAYW